MLGIYYLKIKNIWTCIASDERGIHFSTFSLRDEKEVVAQTSNKLRGQRFQFRKPDATMKSNLRALTEIYYGKSIKIKFNLCTGNLRKFTEKVLRKTMKIPVGYVSTYSIISKAVNNPKSARAVGNVMAKNAFHLIVPCHRVVPSNLNIGKYAAGINEKRGILAREGIEFTGKYNEKIGEKFLYKF